MNELILHHYPGSLFSEKIRAILGFKGLPWRSVEIPPIMPRPLLMPLTGGYRRTPVMQIGADVFCDTHVITEVLDGTYPDPGPADLDESARTLIPAGCEWSARTLTQRADTHLFQVVVALCFQPEAAAAVFQDLGPEMAARFAQDRAQLTAGGGRITAMPPEVATVWLIDELARLEQQLTETEWLLAQEPSLVDFANYASLWLLRSNPVVAPLVEPYPRTLAWMARIADFGHGKPSSMSAEEALERARQTEPRPLVPIEAGDLPRGVELGDDVEIRATDYGFQPVRGRLERCTAHVAAVLREDDAAGAVRVHFPRAGFRIDPA